MVGAHSGHNLVAQIHLKNQNVLKLWESPPFLLRHFCPSISSFLTVGAALISGGGSPKMGGWGRQCSSCRYHHADRITGVPSGP